MATPHNEANSNDISNIVIMCGDPIRVSRISEKYLTNPKLINTIRGMYGYTGYYKNKLITIFAHGMGNPSMGIYSYELYKNYNVDYIIRVGTAGSYDKNLETLDMILATGVYSESNYGYYLGYRKNSIKANPDFNKLLETTAQKEKVNLKKGIVHSTDAFYTKESIAEEMYKNHKTLAVEMESYSLFVNAKLFNKKAACLLVITDNLITQKRLDAQMRVESLDKAIKIALLTGTKL